MPRHMLVSARSLPVNLSLSALVIATVLSWANATHDARAAEAANQRQRPNVVFILADDKY